MKLLIDTNIFLEVILGQEKAKEAQELLRNEEPEFFITDYSLHSIGLLLFRRKLHNVFREFLRDIISEIGFKVAALSVEDMEAVINSAQKFNLDLDDAYQYTVSKQYSLTIVSFDADFDRTENGRKTPSEVGKNYSSL